MKLNFFSGAPRRIVMMMIACFAAFSGYAQDVQMADGMRRDGKIYIVVAVCLTILIGLFLYVISVDRKLRKLEKEK